MLLIEGFSGARGKLGSTATKLGGTMFLKTTPRITEQRRTLRTDLRDGRQELVISNFAGVFGPLSALYSKEHQSKHKRLNLCLDDMWLEKVHKRHLSNDWGQNFTGFPYFIQKFITNNNLKPKDETRPLKWEEVLAIIQAAKLDLAKRSEAVVYGNPIAILQNKLGYKLQYETLSAYGPVIAGLDLDLDVYVYNWFREARQLNISGLIDQNIIDLYAKPTEEVPNTLIISGSGLSLVWAARDFPDSTIYCLLRPGAEIPKIPANEKVKFDNVIFLYTDQVKLEPVKDEPRKLTIKSLDGKISVTADHYSAIGFRPKTELTSLIPPKNKVELGSIQPETWKSTKNIPVGGLFQSFTKYLKETGNFELSAHVQGFHNDSFPETLKKLFAEGGIQLSDQFFKDLEIKVQSHANPVSLKEERSLVLEVLKKAQGPINQDTEDKFNHVMDKFYETHGVKLEEQTSSVPTFQSK